MTNKKNFLYLAIIIGIVLLGIVFWYSQPVSEQTTVSNNVDQLTSQIQNRSSYTNLPITYSSNQVGKSNPFQ
jgi:hypothetical protein